MITINFTGGAKKWFDLGQISIDKNDIDIHQLLTYLIKIKPKETVDIDSKNLLIAINGVDSSALNGYATKLEPNDVVNIIPIIHGGSQKRIRFKITNYNIELFEFKKNKTLDKNFLNSIRNDFPKIQFQAILSSFILNQIHAKKIISLSIFAKKHDTMISKKLETDILLRFAGTTQITKAIQNLGISKNQNFFLIAIGNKILLEKLHKRIFPDLISPLSKNNVSFLKNYFGISNDDINVINLKYPLEELLSERATILI